MFTLLFPWLLLSSRLWQENKKQLLLLLPLTTDSRSHPIFHTKIILHFHIFFSHFFCSSWIKRANWQSAQTKSNKHVHSSQIRTKRHFLFWAHSKHVHSIYVTFQKSHTPKTTQFVWAHSKKSLFPKGHILFGAHSFLSIF